MEKFDTEGRDDINQKSKEEFSSAVNKQKLISSRNLKPKKKEGFLKGL